MKERPKMPTSSAPLSFSSSLVFNISYSLLLSSERASPFHRPFKNALKFTNLYKSLIQVPSPQGKKPNKEAKHLAEARTHCNSQQKGRNWWVDGQQQVIYPIRFSHYGSSYSALGSLSLSSWKHLCCFF